MFSSYKDFEDTTEPILYKRWILFRAYLADKEMKRERLIVLKNIPLNDEFQMLFLLKELLTQTRRCINRLEKDLDQSHHRRIRTVLSYCLDAYKDFYASIHDLQDLVTFKSMTGKYLYSMCPVLQQRISDYPESILNSLFADIMKDRFWLAVFYRSSSLFCVDQTVFQHMLKSIESPEQWEVIEFNDSTLVCHPLLPDPDDFLHPTHNVQMNPWAAMFDVIFESQTKHIKYYKHKVIFSK